MRIKQKDIIPMQAWEQIVQFKFVEEGQDMQWKEKFFITAPDKNKARELSKSFIKRKAKENVNAEKFQSIILKDLYQSGNPPTSSGISIHGQIIDINVL